MLSAIGACSLDEPQPKFFPATMKSPSLTFDGNSDLILPLHVLLIHCNHGFSDMFQGL